MGERTGRTARVLLFDGDGRLVLIRRTRPGVPAYLTTPRGGYEPMLLAVDDPLLAALKPDALAAIVRRDGVALRERAAAIV